MDGKDTGALAEVLANATDEQKRQLERQAARARQHLLNNPQLFEPRARPFVKRLRAARDIASPPARQCEFARIEADVHGTQHEGRASRPASNGRTRGSRRTTGTSASRGDPSDSEPPGLSPEARRHQTGELVCQRCDAPLERGKRGAAPVFCNKRTGQRACFKARRAEDKERSRANRQGRDSLLDYDAIPLALDPTRLYINGDREGAIRLAERIADVGRWHSLDVLLHHATKRRRDYLRVPIGTKAPDRLRHVEAELATRVYTDLADLPIEAAA